MTLSGVYCQAQRNHACPRGITRRPSEWPQSNDDVLLTTVGAQPQVGHFVDQSKGCYEIRMCRKARFRAWGNLARGLGALSKSGWSWGYNCPMGSIDTTVDRMAMPSSAQTIVTARLVLRPAVA
jgi:hypothetical protein